MLFGHARGRAGAARSLSQRPHAARLADRRADRHRQGDARLPHGALRAGAIPIRQAPAVQTATSLALPDDDPAVRRIAAQGASRSSGAGAGRSTRRPASSITVIRVDDVRRTVPFFGSTAGEGGWRVCIVDTADELQDPQAANALLKILEEPPPNALAAAGQPRAGAAAADHPLALPAADAAAAVGGRCGARRRRGARSRCQRARVARSRGAGRRQRRARA